MSCVVADCYGPIHQGAWGQHGYRCERHLNDRNAPAMRVTCECVTPDIERLRIYGAAAAQCRRCGSPITVGGPT